MFQCPTLNWAGHFKFKDMAKLKYMYNPFISTGNTELDKANAGFLKNAGNYVNNISDTSAKSSREWSNDEITNLVGTVANGAAQLFGSFSWLKKPSYQDDPFYSYYPSYNNSGSSSLIWIIGGVAVLALVLFIVLKK